MRPTTILAMATAIVLATTTPALATRYASPAGTDQAPCTLESPCTLAKAITGATLQDKVVRLFGGDYPDPAAGIDTPVEGVDIGPQPGTGRPVIHLEGDSSLALEYESSISDVDFVIDTTNGGAVLLNDGGVTAQRLRVVGSTPGPLVTVGAIGSPSVLRDSLVVNTHTGTNAPAVKIECNGCHSSAQLSHVTAIAQNTPALVAQADSNGNSVVMLDVANSIARSTNPEVEGIRPDATNGTGSDAAWINIADSAYASVITTAREHVVATGRHLTAAPLFTDAAGGDYREAPGSPTIDAGAPSPLDGTGGLDALGGPRALGAATDMGAFEAPVAPVAASGDAAGGTLHGTIAPNGAPAAWHFELGTTTDYGTVVGGGTSGAGFAPEDVAATANGLQPGTTYHYRLVAEHAYGRSVGEDRTFTTPAAAPTPPVADEVFGGVRFAGLKLSLRRGAVSPRLRCPATTACTGTLRLRLGRRVAKATFTIAPGRTANVRVRLGKPMRSALRRSRTPRLRGVITATAAGRTVTTKATLRVG
jgi:hypothetical protein